MRLIVVKRKVLPRYITWAVSAVSLVLGIAVYLAVMALLKTDPLDVLVNIARSFVNPSIVKDLLILIVMGCALLVSFKAALWNIGGEGQFYIAMIPGVLFTLYIFNPETNPAPAPIVVLLSIVVGALLGGLWGLLAALFRAYLKIDEVPVTLILNYIAYYLINYLIFGPFKGRYVYGYLRTDEIPVMYRLNLRVALPPTTNPIVATAYGFIYQLTYYIALLVLAVLVYIATWALMKYTRLGVYIRIHGSNPSYLKAVGVDPRRVIPLVLALSGGIVGLAGSIYLLVEFHRIPYGLEWQTTGYGYLAILVAWLSMLDLKFIPLSAYIVSVLRNAGIALQIAGLGGNEQALLLVGSILLTYSMTRFLVEYEVRVKW
jgi:simple sugar transport system permease protein